MGSSELDVDLFDEDECWARIRDFRVARVGVTVRGHPWVFPVHVHVDRPTIAFRTDAGVILHGARTSPSIAVQFDELAPDGSHGWSVVVGGTVTVTDDAEVIAAFGERSDLPWNSEQKPYLVVVRAQTVTGRSITLHGGA